MKKFTLINRFFEVEFDFRDSGDQTAIVCLTLAVSDETEQRIRDLNREFASIASAHRSDLATAYQLKHGALVAAFGDSIDAIIGYCHEPDTLLLDGILAYVSTAYGDAKTKKLREFLV